MDKLDVDKLKPVSVDLKKLGDVVDKGVPKKSEYNTHKKRFREKIEDAEKKYQK